MFRVCWQQQRTRRVRRTGAVVVFFAVVLVILLGMVAVAVDSGIVMVRRTELQRSTDAAVLAAASALAQADATEEEVVGEAMEFLGANGIDTGNLDQDDIAIEFGAWDADQWNFSSTGFDGSTAVRIVLQDTNNQRFFGRIFRSDGYRVAAEAVAITTSSGDPKDFMLVIDCSGSMDNDQDNPEQPMTAVKEAAQELCTAVGSNDQVGLTVYNWIADEDGDYSYPDNYATGVVERHLTLDAPP